MMNHRLSKLSKTIIIINVIITLFVLGFHVYNVYRIHETNEKIDAVLEENKVLRITAIWMLQKEGEELFLDQELNTIYGIIMCALTLILLYKYAKENLFTFAFSAAFASFLASYIGGILLFYLIFSGKSEVNGKGERFSLKDEWENYIHRKAIVNDNTKV